MEKKKYITPLLQMNVFSEDVVCASYNSKDPNDNIIDGSNGEFVFGD